MKLIAATLFLMAMLTGMAHAQPAQAQRKPAPVPQRLALFTGTGPTTPWLPKTDILPTGEGVEKLAQKLSSRMRNIDPFGLQTFPREDAQPVLEDDGLRTTQRVTLNQALQTLKINGVNLKKKEFLIGGRNAFEGDVVELSYKGEVFQAQVVEVNGTQILFRDLQRNETGVLPHSVVPNVEFEPMRNIASRVEGRMTPLETAKPAQQ